VSPAVRTILLAAALVLAAPFLWRIGAALPAFGQPTAVYGQAVNAIAPGARHVTNMVSAVNFDIRGMDTLGEEFMLLCAVTGAVLLLRGSRGEATSAKAGRIPGRALQPPSDAVRLVCRLFAPLILLFGLYVVLHATVTPGGGFQGGVIVASSLLLLYLGEGYGPWRRLVHTKALDALEGGGAALFALAGLGSMAAGGAYLQNTLPYGRLKDMLSGGLMVVENLGVACAVAGGFALLFLEFMEETRALQSEAEADEPSEEEGR
jgi:multicomponent Na+:H+ antiporter subunit B